MEEKRIYTVVVADDETELREAVCQMVRWEEIGFRLVCRLWESDQFYCGQQYVCLSRSA